MLLGFTLFRVRALVSSALPTSMKLFRSRQEICSTETGIEIKVLYLLEKLRGEAQKAGGDVHVMNGNHEIMNIEGDFRYASPAGLDEFRGWAH